MFVATNELEKPCRGRLVEFDVAQFVDDEKRHGVEVPLLVAGNAVEVCDANLIVQVLGGQEVDAVPTLQRTHAETDRGMRLTDARRPERDDVLRTIDKASVSNCLTTLRSS